MESLGATGWRHIIKVLGLTLGGTVWRLWDKPLAGMVLGPLEGKRGDPGINPLRISMEALGVTLGGTAWRLPEGQYGGFGFKPGGDIMESTGGTVWVPQH